MQVVVGIIKEWITHLSIFSFLPWPSTSDRQEFELLAILVWSSHNCSLGIYPNFYDYLNIHQKERQGE